MIKAFGELASVLQSLTTLDYFVINNLIFSNVYMYIAVFSFSFYTYFKSYSKI